MPDAKSTGSGAQAPNPAKGVETPQIPTKTTRDDGHKIIVNNPRGEKK